MSAIKTKDIFGTVTLIRSRMVVRVIANLKFYPIIGDESIDTYRNFDFGYLSFLILPGKNNTLVFTTNTTSTNKTICFKRAAKVISNYARYATLEKVVIHRIIKWSPTESMTEVERKKLKKDLSQLGPTALVNYAKTLFPKKITELERLKKEMEEIHLSFDRLAARLQIASGSKTYSDLTENTIIEINKHLGKPHDRRRHTSRLHFF